ncbi:hypothetical protein [uncultured Arcobacter sp.]|uniref:hypothetical protein n=1 Tax=uncultured Arcobacter sp. TaxID=165434 RepID=UPI00261B0B0E|nr:hypothetical protein [uncultured Arcobacter sp.]
MSIFGNIKTNVVRAVKSTYTKITGKDTSPTYVPSTSSSSGFTSTKTSSSGQAVDYGKSFPSGQGRSIPTPTPTRRTGGGTTSRGNNLSVPTQSSVNANKNLTGGTNVNLQPNSSLSSQVSNKKSSTSSYLNQPNFYNKANKRYRDSLTSTYVKTGKDQSTVSEFKGTPEFTSGSKFVDFFDTNTESQYSINYPTGKGGAKELLDFGKTTPVKQSRGLNKVNELEKQNPNIGDPYFLQNEADKIIKNDYANMSVDVNSFVQNDVKFKKAVESKNEYNKALDEISGYSGKSKLKTAGETAIYAGTSLLNPVAGTGLLVGKGVYEVSKGSKKDTLLVNKNNDFPIYGSYKPSKETLKGYFDVGFAGLGAGFGANEVFKTSLLPPTKSFSVTDSSAVNVGKNQFGGDNFILQGESKGFFPSRKDLGTASSYFEGGAETTPLEGGGSRVYAQIKSGTNLDKEIKVNAKGGSGGRKLSLSEADITFADIDAQGLSKGVGEIRNKEIGNMNVNLNADKELKGLIDLKTGGKTTNSLVNVNTKRINKVENDFFKIEKFGSASVQDTYKDLVGNTPLMRGYNLGTSKVLSLKNIGKDLGSFNSGSNSLKANLKFDNVGGGNALATAEKMNQQEVFKALDRIFQEAQIKEVKEIRTKTAGSRTSSKLISVPKQSFQTPSISLGDLEMPKPPKAQTKQKMEQKNEFAFLEYVTPKVKTKTSSSTVLKEMSLQMPKELTLPKVTPKERVKLNPRLNIKPPTFGGIPDFGFAKETGFGLPPIALPDLRLFDTGRNKKFKKKKRVKSKYLADLGSIQFGIEAPKIPKTYGLGLGGLTSRPVVNKRKSKKKK